MLANQDIAVLTKLNDLAERRGLKPYDFIAVAGFKDDAYILNFEMPASGNALREERFQRMLNDLGIVVGDSATLTGTPEVVIDRIESAIAMTPRGPRSL